MNTRLLLFAASLGLLAASARALEARPDSDDDSGDQDHVVVMDDTLIPSTQTVQGDCVTVMGNAVINGHVTHDAVVVLGNAQVDGHIEHDLVVIGDLQLGPHARIEHDVVCMGALHRDPAAFIGHNMIQPWHGPSLTAPLRHSRSWWDAGGRRGQYLVFGHGVSWLWTISLTSLLISMVIAVIVPGPVHAAGELLVLRPGMVVLAGLAMVIGFPVALLLLMVTVVGIPVAIIMGPIAFIFAIWFGRAAIYSLIARRMTRENLHPALAVLAGAVVVMLLLFLPIVGVLCYLLLLFFAWSLAWAALFSSRSQAPAVAGIVPPPPPPPPPAAGFAAPPPVYTTSAAEPPPLAQPSPIVTPPPPVPPPPAFGAATFAAPPVATALLPRAGFWRRMGALFIDVLLVAIVSGILASMFEGNRFRGDHGGPGFFFLLLAVYAAVMWKIRGTTIGGIICHLAVVRLDGRPIDWSTAIVRALGCFVSLFVAGLGFIWIAIDPDHQSWHDKIAGTAVVIAPRHQSLV